MDIKVIAVNILLCIKDLLPYLIAVSIATALVAALFLILFGKFWSDHRVFKVMGVLFELDGMQMVRLAAAWMAFVITIVFAVRFKKMNSPEYVLFLIPALVGAIKKGGFIKTLVNLGWIFLQTLLIFAMNLICGYISDVGGGLLFRVLYCFVGIFVVIFAGYVFLMLVDDISEERMMNFGKERNAVFEDNRGNDRG